jgi:uncharacterized protein YqiB (DUF1249 family)
MSILASKHNYILQRLHEQNFSLLMRLLPHVREYSGAYESTGRDGHALYLKVLDVTPYTMTIALTEYIQTGSFRLAYPDLELRLYFDARVAEVLRYKSRTGISWHDPDPEYRRLTRSTMLRLNEFLHNWLIRCLNKGHQFAPVCDTRATEPESSTT